MRALALEAAEAMSQIERMEATLAAQGEIQTDSRGIMRPHPAVEIRHKAGMRLMALMTKLRLLPSQDTRDLQQRARYENERSTPFVVPEFPPIPLKDDGTPDWVAFRKGKKCE